MYFKWADGYTKILSHKVKPRGLNHKDKRPTLVYITYTEVAYMVRTSRNTAEFLSKIRAIETALHPVSGIIIPVYL